MSVGFVPQSEPVSIAMMIKVISISRCDVVVRVDAVENALSSLGVMSVPGRSDAWVRYGSVKILVVARCVCPQVFEGCWCSYFRREVELL